MLEKNENEKNVIKNPLLNSRVSRCWRRSRDLLNSEVKKTCFLKTERATGIRASLRSRQSSSCHSEEHSDVGIP